MVNTERAIIFQCGIFGHVTVVAAWVIRLFRRSWRLILWRLQLGSHQLLVGASCHQLGARIHGSRRRLFVTKTFRFSNDTSQ